eukprot:COSAG01_NODE_2032_length_8583_cov_14.706271_4_plen_51_part_00
MQVVESQYHFRSPRLIFERQSLHMAPSHPDVRHAASEALGLSVAHILHST